MKAELDIVRVFQTEIEKTIHILSGSATPTYNPNCIRKLCNLNSRQNDLCEIFSNYREKTKSLEIFKTC